jgi:hypothetical protein
MTRARVSRGPVPGRPVIRGAALQACLVAAACGDPAAPGDGAPARIVVASGNEQRAVAATPLPAPVAVRVTDAAGRPVRDRPVLFTVVAGGGSLAPAFAATDADGVARTAWTLGPSTSAAHRAEARVADLEPPLAVLLSATALPDAPATAAIAAGDAQTRVAGAALRDSLVVAVTDRLGNPVPGVPVAWSAPTGGGRVSPASSVTDARGLARTALMLGPAPGPNRVVAMAPGLPPVAFEAVAVPPPVILAVTPDTLRPGATVAISGLNFSPTLADNVVRVRDTPAQVISATPTEIRFTVPCESGGAASVTVATNGLTLARTHLLTHGPPVRLAPGEARVLDGLLPGCVELVPGGGRYLLSVLNPGTADVVWPVRVRGLAPQGTAAADAGAAFPTAPRPAPPAPAAAHGQILDNSVQLVARLGPAGALPAPPVPAVHDTLEFRVPDPTVDLCVARASVRARVVHAGPRAVVLEDVRAPLAGAMDSLYRALGEEFERVQAPLLERHFAGGVLDGVLPGGRVFMLFSRVVNELANVAGFASSSDFFPADRCPASNQAPVFYGFVPTDSARGFGNGLVPTRDNWYRTIRAAAIHEARHLISFAGRIGAGQPPEERWLEEAAAMVAEELYAREVAGLRARGNTGYQESLFCERRPEGVAFPECRGRPVVMYTHFALLNHYAAAVETRSPLGPATPADLTFYGSGWAFLRWVLDHHAADEAAFLRALTAGPLTGLASLHALTGADPAALLQDWSLALALDDRPGFTVADPRHTLPSWNLRDIFQRMSQELPLQFPRPFPLAVRSVPGASFMVDLPALRGGTAALLEFRGAGDRQLIHVSATAPAAPRAVLVRID